MSYKCKKYLFLIFNTIVPLISGLAIYIFMKSGTFINTFSGVDFHYIPKTVFGLFIVNWFCDFLWAYALVFALYTVLSPFKSKLLFSCVISALLGLILEIMQGVNILSGTFDWWDIIIEFVAIVTATIILKNYSSCKS